MGMPTGGAGEDLERSVEHAADAVLARPDPPRAARLVAVSGIDGSGKGHCASRLAAALARRGRRVALIGVDDWLTPPERRAPAADPAAGFYADGLRFGDLFASVIDPLARHGAARHTEACFRPDGSRPVRTFDYAGVDLVLVEGIFLLRRSLRARFDFSVWIDCTYDTALERALARNQEGLPPAEIVRDYRTVYFPAQRLHERLDRPRRAADLVVANDHRLGGGG